jgi:hypothetical protein
MAWKDSIRQLTIDNRQGNYSGMQASKVFRVVIAEGKSFDPLAEETEAREISYNGNKMVADAST